MPTYDYECSQCGHKWEEFQSITAKPLRKCPECGRLKAKRVIGAGGGIIFKGSGFYQTDYRSSSYKKDAAADSKAQTPSSDTKSSGDSSTSSKSGASDS
ncbi:FmdB family zinc ribbon protein [Gimesia sp.]|mgnify:CR=1 FL=1|uniref:FmdB family zinc ribbon protein n=1 Tax=Gimesia sp. TaxID=2024833 RepID=UPI000C68C708|nr:FmdB family zinc ribbon protein [Gimesia sp.]MAX35052.1 FmdB family transcriptional regulator [Gimesia sp.]HBL43886.1 FmdB family transcriptional regulator [Planctomycetaceae bacterium]|tara:strand:- start:196 stop:492 length:297 start_codon:yes stop_codon:yes gene_type:complete